MSISVAAVVVTYNRKALLQECLEAILRQTAAVEKIILIDNASTDGTPEMLRESGLMDRPQMQYVRMVENTGGAGGFYEGLRIGRECGCKALWLMDDDTIPQEDALEKLLRAAELLEPAGEQTATSRATESAADDICSFRAANAAADCRKDARAEDDPSVESPVSFLASCVYGPGGECMNAAKLDRTPEANGSEGWYRYLGQGLLQIESATFVSVLIRTEAVRRCGLPCRDYFIWGDDVEYTNRLTHYYGKAYLVGESRVVHKRAGTAALNIAYETDPSRIRMFHYDYRNQAINNRFYKKGMGTAANVIRNVFTAFRMLREEKGFLKARTILQGTMEALISYPRFRDCIEAQLRTGENQ